MAECTNCNEVLTTPLACGSCESIFAAPFTLSPFEVFGMPIAARLDPSILRKKLLKMQRLLHPDFHGAAGQAMQSIAEHNTAEVNAAFKVLRDEAQRSSWLVEHLGGPSESNERQMPQAFLMEVMEWNETLEGFGGLEDKATAASGLGELKAELNIQRVELLEGILDNLEAQLSQAADAAPLADVRRSLNAARYIDRALTEVASIELQIAHAH
jgi:molecular chaperone HscB